jgi:hypothetical protein
VTTSRARINDSGVRSILPSFRTDQVRVAINEKIGLDAARMIPHEAIIE